MSKTLNIIGLLILSFSLLARGEDLKMPSFLPHYYLPGFEVGEQDLVFIESSDVNELEQWLYSTPDQSITLSIENIKCDSAGCPAILNNIFSFINIELKEEKGEFLELTEREIFAKLYDGDKEHLISVYALPGSIQVWNYSIKPELSDKINSISADIKAFVNRQRYTDALAEGNVSMGTWGDETYDYASQLLKQGKKSQACSVLKDIITTSPYNYDAHIAFSENTNNLTESLNSANIVFKNAEDPKLIDRAAKILKKDLKTYDSIPLLQKDEKGLQLILIPFEPCNILFIDEAARTYENMTNIPVKIRRLPIPPKISTNDRIIHQRTIQDVLISLNKKTIDFTGWTKDKYIQELTKSVASENAISKYRVKDLINSVKDEPGQCLVDPLLNWFSNMLKKYRSNDARTMYVAVTEVDIYSGDNNYLFSSGIIDGPSKATVLSYHMMLSETLYAEFQSRKRLTDRMAKELVPAGFKLLGIPRSTDPTCPFSYSSGVERLDQKTMVLSDSLKQALKKMRE